MILGISTTIQGRPHAQEWMANTMILYGFYDFFLLFLREITQRWVGREQRKSWEKLENGKNKIKYMVKDK